MYELIFGYVNENGMNCSQEYRTIQDFINDMKSDNIDLPMLDYTNVNAVFYGKEQKNFNTVADLLEYCKKLNSSWIWS